MRVVEFSVRIKGGGVSSVGDNIRHNSENFELGLTVTNKVIEGQTFAFHANLLLSRTCMTS